MSATHATQSTAPQSPVLCMALELSLATWKLAFTVGSIIFATKDRLLSPIPALGDVMAQTRRDNPCQSSHDQNTVNPTARRQELRMVSPKLHHARRIGPRAGHRDRARCPFGSSTLPIRATPLSAGS